MMGRVINRVADMIQTHLPNKEMRHAAVLGDGDKECFRGQSDEITLSDPISA